MDRIRKLQIVMCLTLFLCMGLFCVMLSTAYALNLSSDSSMNSEHEKHATQKADYEKDLGIRPMESLNEAVPLSHEIAPEAARQLRMMHEERKHIITEVKAKKAAEKEKQGVLLAHVNYQIEQARKQQEVEQVMASNKTLIFAPLLFLFCSIGFVYLWAYRQKQKRRQAPSPMY